MKPVQSLCADPDLGAAAELSGIRRSIKDDLLGWQNAAMAVAGLVKQRLSQNNPRFQVVHAKGVSHSGAPLDVLYAGTGANRQYCFSLLFERCDETVELLDAAPHEVAQHLRERQNACSFVFVEGIGARALPEAAAGFDEMPAWVKQRLRISPTWPEQIDGMRRPLRQEIRRLLRKYRYDCRVTGEEAAAADFHDRLYRPSVTRKFGMAAVLVERHRFLAECRRGVVLQLTHRNSVVAASLLRQTGRTMSIVWTGTATDAESEGLRGRSDLLDYFSLLYGHLKGCRWLDFGPSRPDLYDGALRYKAKWGAELYAGTAPQATIRWMCNSEDVRTEFLRRHDFQGKTAGSVTCNGEGLQSPFR